MRLLFIRHGEPDYGNDCLTETGHIQAQRCAERLKSEGIDLIFSSSMGRARQTAQYTADILGKDIQILDYMHEIVWGHEGVRDYHHDDSPWVITDRMAAEDGDLLDAGWAEGRWFSGNKCVENVRMIAEETDAFLAELGHVREGSALCPRGILLRGHRPYPGAPLPLRMRLDPYGCDVHKHTALRASFQRHRHPRDGADQRRRTSTVDSRRYPLSETGDIGILLTNCKF